MKLIEVGDLTLRFEDKCGFCGSSDVEAVNMASDTHVRCRGCKTRTPRCDNIRDAVQLWNWWFAAAGARPYESDSGTRFERLAALREHEAGLKRQADALEAGLKRQADALEAGLKRQADALLAMRPK